MTVYYEMDLLADVALPQHLSLRIPANTDVLALSNTINDETGEPLTWEVIPDGEWQYLQFTTESVDIRLVVYDPGIVKQGQLRSYEFEWLSAYPVHALTFMLQIPYCAGALVTDPQMSRADTSSQNCACYVLEAGQVEAEEPFLLAIQYEKDLSNPDYPALSVHAAEEVNDFTRGRTASPLSVVIWLGAVALAMIILVGLYYWWFRRQMIPQQARPSRGAVIDHPEKQAIFCHECGSRSRPGDTFCRNCGTELRRFH